MLIMLAVFIFFSKFQLRYSIGGPDVSLSICCLTAPNKTPVLGSDRFVSFTVGLRHCIASKTEHIGGLSCKKSHPSCSNSAISIKYMFFLPKLEQCHIRRGYLVGDKVLTGAWLATYPWCVTQSALAQTSG